MTIAFTKLDHTTHRIDLTRRDGSAASAVLDTKTYFLHDACHYFVEQALHYPNGFWGLLAAGWEFAALSAKTNVETEGLRFLEKIVGPVQSVVSGHLAPGDFAQAVAHLHATWLDGFSVTGVVGAIHAFMQRWDGLAFGETLRLDFEAGRIAP